MVGDTSGYIVNRLLVPYLLDGIRALESRVAPADGDRHRDEARLRPPDGPARARRRHRPRHRLRDGQDACTASSTTRATRRRRCCAVWCLNGHLGKKTNLGIFDYATEPPRENARAVAGGDPRETGLRITRIDHVAVCVEIWTRRFRPGSNCWGCTPGAREYVDAQKTEAAFFADARDGRLHRRADRAEGRQRRASRSSSTSTAAVGAAPHRLRRRRSGGRAQGARRRRRAAHRQDAAAGARGHLVGFLHPKAADGISDRVRLGSRALAHAGEALDGAHVRLAHRAAARRAARADAGGRHPQGARRRSDEGHAGRGGAAARGRPQRGAGAGDGRRASTSTACGRRAGKPVSVFKMHKEPFHIAGSDASGIVWKVGKEVRRWKVGDEVVIHCNQSCGQCPECNGLDPMACSRAEDLGLRDLSWGSFAQFTKVQSQQLVPKPKHLSWEEAASYGLTYFTAYRMLVGRAQVKPGDNVLVWGAAGGLGIFALQLCKLIGANPIAVVSSPDKYDLVRVARRHRRHQPQGLRLRVEAERDAGADQEAHGRDQAARRRDPQADRRQGPRHRLRARRPGDLPRVGVLVQALRQDRHLRRDLAASISTFDVRYLWMRQKEILGSHFANAYQAERANELVIDRQDQAGARPGLRLRRHRRWRTSS